MAILFSLEINFNFSCLWNLACGSELCMFMHYAKDIGGSDTSCELDEDSKPTWSKIEKAKQLS